MIAQFSAKPETERSWEFLRLAGAEGFEPSARGFGVDVEAVVHLNAFRLFQPLAGFRRFPPLRFDALLMLWRKS